MAALTPDLEGKIEAYLLGRLPRGEQTRIEALLFEDDDVFEAIRDAEDDLIDRYVAGELPQTDRDAFEHAFAVSTSRQERIALARALSHAVASGASASADSTSGASASGASAPVAPALVVPPPVAPEPVAPAPIAAPPIAAPPIAAPPIAALPIAAPPAAVDFPRRHSRPISDARRLIFPAGATLAAALVIAIAWRALIPGTTPSGPAAGDAASGSGETGSAPPDGVAIATFSLGRNELRRGSGSLPRLALPRGTKAIRLQPELEAPIPAGCTVTLRRIEGPVVWQETAGADLGSDRFSVTVPTRLVGPGDYVLSLAASGAPPEDRAEYPFRIVVPD